MMKKMMILVGGLLTMNTAVKAEIPELMRTEGGQAVTSVAQWEQTRRPEILELFKEHVYGRTPVGRPDSLRFEALGADTEVLDGKAVRKRVRIHFEGPDSKGQFDAVAIIPKGERKAPGFLLICISSPEENQDAERTLKSPSWPVEEIISRGYAALMFYTQDVAPDKDTGFKGGVHTTFIPDPEKRTPASWGTLAAWAWGASRVMDWVETEPLLDAKRIAVMGHSRGGKTALWCGANDARFALVISNESGCGGAKLHRMDLPKSEHVAQITQNFGYWFCDNFKKYVDNDAALPIDQHQLLALMAPRLVYVASAEGDPWAGPEGEFESCKLSSPVWALYGKKGLVGDTFPAVETPLQEGSVGYHIRSGKHDLALYDWKRFMDFADKHGWKK